MDDPMTVGELITVLQGMKPDIPVVSGVDRSGYGEPVVGIDIVELKAFNHASGEFDGEKIVVLDLKLANESIGVVPEPTLEIKTCAACGHPIGRHEDCWQHCGTVKGGGSEGRPNGCCRECEEIFERTDGDEQPPCCHY